MVVTMEGAADRRSAESAEPERADSVVRSPRRCHGSLDTITDSERRALRPITIAAHDVAVRTGVLLAELLTLPGVRIFQGVRSAAADLPRIPHAISTGRQVLLVESVAWPAGRYATTPAGRIHCDGIYIGQSVRPLLAAVWRWREALPYGHLVTAIVIVHPSADGDITLPAAASKDIAWAHAADAVRYIREQLPPGQQPVSISAVAALVAAATADEDR
jgi:hypothetical protein